MSLIVSGAGLYKSFRRKTRTVDALKNVSLEVETGELVAIRGPSGCGKSTLLLAVGGLQKPDSGTIKVVDQDVYQLSPEQRTALRARRIGFVFQQFHLIPYLSVMENVLAAQLGVAVRRNGSSTSRASELVQRLGLDERRDHRPAELSVGECQRVALARALLNEPQLILADEPTGNLDEENTGIVLQHLRDIANSGSAVLLVTHDPKCDAIADRMLQMREGCLI